MQIVAEYYTSTTMNLATALGFFSRMCSLQSLKMPETEHQLVTALSVESWPGVLQLVQKHIRGWKICLEAKMGFPVREISSDIGNSQSVWKPLPINYGDGGSIQSESVIDKPFSIPKCVRLARMSHHSHRLLRKILGAVPEDKRENLSEIWGDNY